MDLLPVTGKSTTEDVDIDEVVGNLTIEVDLRRDEVVVASLATELVENPAIEVQVVASLATELVENPTTEVELRGDEVELRRDEVVVASLATEVVGNPTTEVEFGMDVELDWRFVQQLKMRKYISNIRKAVPVPYSGLKVMMST